MVDAREGIPGGRGERIRSRTTSQVATPHDGRETRRICWAKTIGGLEEGQWAVPRAHGRPWGTAARQVLASVRRGQEDRKREWAGSRALGSGRLLRVARQTTVIIHHMHVCSVPRGRQRRRNATAAAGSKIACTAFKGPSVCARNS